MTEKDNQIIEALKDAILKAAKKVDGGNASELIRAYQLYPQAVRSELYNRGEIKSPASIQAIQGIADSLAKSNESENKKLKRLVKDRLKDRDCGNINRLTPLDKTFIH